MEITKAMTKSEYHEHQAARLRELLADTTTPQLKARLLEEATKHEQLGRREGPMSEADREGASVGQLWANGVPADLVRATLRAKATSPITGTNGPEYIAAPKISKAAGIGCSAWSAFVSGSPAIVGVCRLRTARSYLQTGEPTAVRPNVTNYLKSDKIEWFEIRGISSA
jgi:hypothetical protein